MYVQKPYERRESFSVFPVPDDLFHPYHQLCHKQPHLQATLQASAAKSLLLSSKRIGATPAVYTNSPRRS
jgi:hypothetical protein